MDRGAWQATFHGVTGLGHDLATKPSSWDQNGFFPCLKKFFFKLHLLEKDPPPPHTHHHQE